MRKTINIDKLEEVEVKELERFALAILDRLRSITYHKHEGEMTMNENSGGQFDRFEKIAKDRHEACIAAHNAIKGMPKPN